MSGSSRGPVDGSRFMWKRNTVSTGSTAFVGARPATFLGFATCVEKKSGLRTQSPVVAAVGSGAWSGTAKTASSSGPSPPHATASKALRAADSANDLMSAASLATLASSSASSHSSSSCSPPASPSVPSSPACTCPAPGSITSILRSTVARGLPARTSSVHCAPSRRAGRNARHFQTPARAVWPSSPTLTCSHSVASARESSLMKTCTRP
mmetsp:Transcript_7896/g.27729  ORF Transcript_7896/g.27729 Transcript_7896/m.27729 type:complete len:210 (-) Transcript_7896:72-701(-)